MPSEVPSKKVLVADEDEIVAFIASHVLSRYDFAVVTTTSAQAVAEDRDGYDAVVVSAGIAAKVGKALPAAHTIVVGDDVHGIEPFARLRKPLELGELVAAVTACANRR